MDDAQLRDAARPGSTSDSRFIAGLEAGGVEHAFAVNQSSNAEHVWPRRVR